MKVTCNICNYFCTSNNKDWWTVEIELDFNYCKLLFTNLALSMLSYQEIDDILKGDDKEILKRSFGDPNCCECNWTCYTLSIKNGEFEIKYIIAYGDNIIVKLPKPDIIKFFQNFKELKMLLPRRDDKPYYSFNKPDTFISKAIEFGYIVNSSNTTIE